MTAPTDDSTIRALTPAQCAALRDTGAASLGSVAVGSLSALSPERLPLNACCSRGGIPDSEDWSLSCLSTVRAGSTVTARLGLFFTEIVGGCNCHDDPSRFNDYQVVTAEIDCVSGSVRWTLNDD